MSQLRHGQPLPMLAVVAAVGVLGVFARDCANDEFLDPYTRKCDPCGPICAVGDCSNVCPNYTRQTDSSSTTTAVATTTTATVIATENNLSTFVLVMIIAAAVLFLLVVALLFIILYIKFYRKKREVFINKVTTKPKEETAKDSNPEILPLTNGSENV